MDINPNYVSAPQILNGFDEIQKRDLTLRKHENIKKQVLLYVKSHEEKVFADILTSPFFLMSEKMHRIAKKYEPTMVSKQVALVDKDNQAAELYYLPILPRIDCISPQSELNNGKTKFITPVIDPHRTLHKHIFWLKGFNSDLPVITLDLAESFLRRDLKGIDLTLMNLE